MVRTGHHRADCLNSGVSVFAEATKHRALYEMKLSQPVDKA
ncbi:MAG: hypothetical protein U0694_06340 [Anaerolineae bacterium]